MSRFVALIALLLAACQPFYRDDLRAGQRVEKSSEVSKLLDDADRAANAGDLKRASGLAYDAIRENPSYSTRGYVILAMAFTRAGNAGAASKAIALGQKHFGSSMTSAMFDAYAREDRIADALDYIKATTFSDAKGYSVGQLTQLANADDAKTTDAAMQHYLAWREVYGVPDHAALRDAVDRITKRIGDDIDHRTPLGMRLLAIGPHADAASARGDVAGALTLYALAERILPANKFVGYRAAMARTAAKVTDVSAIDPVASNFALDGDAALKAGKIPAAIHAYRLAVAHAPWWGNAHGNLAELLALAGHPGDAALERVWASGLAAGGWATETASAPPTDLDSDGVLDPGDQCPYEAEDKDGFDDTDGCPEPDNDRDGRADAIDKCPTEGEDQDGFQDDDGCPDPDNDRDGLPDLSDACPTQPETINGTADTDGCPDEGRVVVTATDITILDPIAFEGRTAKLAKASSKILDAIVATLAGRPTLMIEVGVHTNVVATVAQARAAAVVKYLVDHGIAANRLMAVGYTDVKPRDPTRVELKPRSN